MSLKKVFVEGVGNVLLSDQTEYKELLNTEGVKCLLDSERNRVGGFTSLVDGGKYILGPRQQQPYGKLRYQLFLYSCIQRLLRFEYENGSIFLWNTFCIPYSCLLL